MTEILTGKQVLALLAQDEVPEIEYMDITGVWCATSMAVWHVETLQKGRFQFRIKPTPQPRLSVTLANGEVVSWPEPVREALEDGQVFWYVDSDYEVMETYWRAGSPVGAGRLAFGNVHLTKEAAQEHADALHKINTQGV